MSITPENLHRTYQAAMNADSWGDLEKRVLDKKDPLLPKRFVKDKERFIMAIGALHSLTTKEFRVQPESDFPFPSSRTIVDDITYHVHGIQHDMQHRRVMKKHFKKLEECVLESDLSILYSTRGVDHPRHDELKYVSMLDTLWMLFHPMIIISQLIDHALFFRRQKTEEEVGGYRKVGNILVDGTYEPVDISQTVLPEHLAHSWLGYQLEDRFERAVLLRSLAQAEYIKKTAKRMGVPEMHSIVGLAHERQIIYFLENPDTATLLANIYRPSPPVRLARKVKSSTLLISIPVYKGIEQLARRAEHSLDMIEQGLDPYPPIPAEYGLMAFTLLSAAILYRKHKHRFTNKMYIRSLLSPKKD